MAAMFLGLSRQNLMRQSFRYLLLGEGEVGLMVYTILLHTIGRKSGLTNPGLASS